LDGSPRGGDCLDFHHIVGKRGPAIHDQGDAITFAEQAKFPRGHWRRESGGIQILANGIGHHRPIRLASTLGAEYGEWLLIEQFADTLAYLWIVSILLHLHIESVSKCRLVTIAHFPFLCSSVIGRV
jgi:hypothetical protein